MRSLIEFLKTCNFAYTDYSTIRKGTTYENPLTIYMFMPVYEGLITTFPIDKTIEYIKDYFDLEDSQIRKSNGANGVERINVTIANRDDNLELMKKAMSYCGYFLGFPKEDKIPQNAKFVELQFEARHQKDISSELRREETTLIHITPKYNLKKIQKIGFSPRCKNEFFDYPGRIYFVRGSVNNQVSKIIAGILSNANMSIGNTGEYVIITVDLTKIPDSIKFYEDPNFPKGLFVNENLKPDIITNIEETKM